MKLLRGSSAGMAAAGAACLALLASCGGTTRGEQAFNSGAVPGLNYQVGPVKVRDVYVTHPPGGDSYDKGASAQVHLVLVNGGTGPARLVSAASKVAGGAQLLQRQPCAGSFSVSSQLTVPPLPAAPITTNPGPQLLRQPQYAIRLQDLNRKVHAGENIPLTITFRAAGTLSIDVPVQSSDRVAATASPSPTSCPSPGTGSS